MKNLAAATLVVLVTLVLGVAPGQDKKDGDDKAKFQGTWQYKSITSGGQKKDIEEKLTLTVTGDKYVVKLNDEVVQEGTQKLNPTKKPPEIDIKIEKGADEGTTLIGIYEIKGDDVRVCVAKDKEKRPAEFKAGEGQFLVEMKRVKAK